MESQTPKEKYLTIQILGSKGLRVAAFKNKDKEKNPKAPDFKGDGVAVWINTKEDKPKPVQEDVI